MAIDREICLTDERLRAPVRDGASSGPLPAEERPGSEAPAESWPRAGWWAEILRYRTQPVRNPPVLPGPRSEKRVKEAAPLESKNSPFEEREERN